MFSFVICVTGIWANFALPFALERIGWMLYVVNASWNIAIFIFIAYYWVEVKGKTLEEIDVLFDGVKHSDVPDIEMVLSGLVDGSWKERAAHWMRCKCPIKSEHNSR